MNNKHKHSHHHKSHELTEQEIDELIEQVYDSEDEEESARILDRILKADPNNVEAMLLKADLIEEDSERIELLSNALHVVDELIDTDLDDDDHDYDNDEDEEYDEEDIFQVVKLAIMQRMAFTLFNLGDLDCALDMASECIKHDISDDSKAHDIYYRILIEMGEWQRILTETMQDDEHYLGWAYARVVAAFMLTPGAQNGQKDYTTAARMFWEALTMSPNVPFYILGYCPEPADDSDVEIEDFGFACLYTDILSFSRELLNWFTRGAILFGLLSGRFEGDVYDFMMDVLEKLGGVPEFEKMSGLITASDDETIIETLAAHHCLARG